jgi:hypothetical protein
VVPWLAPDVIKGCWSLWEARLDKDRLSELKRLLAECSETHRREYAVDQAAVGRHGTT